MLRNHIFALALNNCSLFFPPNEFSEKRVSLAHIRQHPFFWLHSDEEDEIDEDDEDEELSKERDEEEESEEDDHDDEQEALDDCESGGEEEKEKNEHMEASRPKRE